MASVESELWDRAIKAMKDVPFGEGAMIIQLLDEPSFAFWTCWTVLGIAGRFDVKQIVWAAETDLERVEDLENLPESFALSLSTTRATLDTDKLTALIDQGSKISVPLIEVDFPIGTDGETHTLTIRSFPRPISLTWWSDGPDAWRELTEWARELRWFLKGSVLKAGLSTKSE